MNAPPACYCGHRHDQHHDDRDWRAGGCQLCECFTYTPNHETRAQSDAKRQFERAIFGDNRVFK